MDGGEIATGLPKTILYAGVPEGYDAVVTAEVAATGTGRDVLFVVRDDKRLAEAVTALNFFAPDVRVLPFPAWDCLPYDRVSPRSDIIAQRIDTLTALLEQDVPGSRIVVATVAAVLQRVPAPVVFQGASLSVSQMDGISRERLVTFLDHNGYGRSDTVMEPGEYALRGSIIDLFPPGFDDPLRLDFFGDDLESIRTFDAVSQRTSGTLETFNLKPVSELQLNEDAITRFRTGYRALFGMPKSDDPLYESISAGRSFMGVEHWLPLFQESLATIVDYVPEGTIVFDYQAAESREARLTLIADCFDARTDVAAKGLVFAEAVYNPLPVERLYVPGTEFDSLLAGREVIQFHPFAAPESDGAIKDKGGRPGQTFAGARAQPELNVFDALKSVAEDEARSGRQVLLACQTEGSRERLAGMLREHGLSISAEPSDALIQTVVLPLESGFTSPDVTVISEQDVLGERLQGRAQRRIKPENFIAEAAALHTGDLVVHAEHGIGRFEELVTLDVAGAAHDCLALTYHDGDKLFLPVENIDVISRFGEEGSEARLDKLGGVAWQARKAKLKERIREMADQLIAIAAARQLKAGEIFEPQAGPYDAFCAGFPFQETEDQTRSIGDVIGDLAAGRPMDRLVCGDVGFGKTEVALRAAFVAAMEGQQVAVVVPTTLLARQHFRVFSQRFKDFPVKVAQLSRLVGPKDVATTKAELTDGTVDIVIGTHALLAKDIQFQRLGFLIIDEEQHFGVAHKERLKQLKTNVHVLTLTATPIPRTLQLALTGVRELSLITTPPVDRLAVRTFVIPKDPMVLREAINRERLRGGQIFYVCPRISDISHLETELSELVPDLRIAVAHGQLPPTQLEDVMNTFYEGAYDLLLSTNIVESGLDLPSVNTIIIHRADRFGLAQLYQLRGRIGRSKLRGYAYLTLPQNQQVTPAAQKRLEVMQALDSLGAGFMLASHDLDIRGAGNLLGDEQSGHIKEVGIELYQQMLEEAVAAAKSADDPNGTAEDQWTPQMDIGLPVLIPEEYVPDLSVRLALYRRAAGLLDASEIEAFAAELIDRFGSLPSEVENLLATVGIKQLCRAANVEKVDAGPKGGVITFRKNQVAYLEGLVTFITTQAGTAKLRPDHKLVFMRAWNKPSDRLAGVQYLMRQLADVASQ
ncbi:MAG: transcription-repair coupling factor [Rhodospirillaceae bacterium TMED167]|nr:transcription-repair coupling factor [Rhodospirillaceae bacterium]OUW27187.1 MAG: transcription-repair coupling factor [Rhodospirillaceae bacterium TMED167]